MIFSKFEQLQKQKSLKYLIDEGIEIDFNWLHPQNETVSKFEQLDNAKSPIVIKFVCSLNIIDFNLEHP